MEEKSAPTQCFTGHRHPPVLKSGHHVPTGLAAVAVSVGDHHTVALAPDGTLRAWGVNTDGRLGDGTSTNRSAPLPVQGHTGIVAIHGGSGHTLALRGDDTVWAWGRNVSGQLGDGTSVNRSTPVALSGVWGRHLRGGRRGLLAGGRGRRGRRGERLGVGRQRLRAARRGRYAAASAVGSGTELPPAARSAPETRGRWPAHLTDRLVMGRQRLRPAGGRHHATAAAAQAIGALARVTTIGLGAWHRLAAGDDGLAWVWGYNDHGEAGNGGLQCTGAPCVVPARLAVATAALHVGAGAQHSILLGGYGRVRGTVPETCSCVRVDLPPSSGSSCEIAIGRKTSTDSRVLAIGEHGLRPRPGRCGCVRRSTGLEICAMDRARSSVHRHDELVGTEAGDRATVAVKDVYVHCDQVHRRTERGRLLQRGSGSWVASGGTLRLLRHAHHVPWVRIDKP